MCPIKDEHLAVGPEPMPDDKGRGVAKTVTVAGQKRARITAPVRSENIHFSYTEMAPYITT